MMCKYILVNYLLLINIKINTVLIFAVVVVIFIIIVAWSMLNNNKWPKYTEPGWYRIYYPYDSRGENIREIPYMSNGSENNGNNNGNNTANNNGNNGNNGTIAIQDTPQIMYPWDVDKTIPDSQGFVLYMPTSMNNNTGIPLSYAKKDMRSSVKNPAEGSWGFIKSNSSDPQAVLLNHDYYHMPGVRWDSNDYPSIDGYPKRMSLKDCHNAGANYLATANAATNPGAYFMYDFDNTNFRGDGVCNLASGTQAILDMENLGSGPSPVVQTNRFNFIPNPCPIL